MIVQLIQKLGLNTSTVQTFGMTSNSFLNLQRNSGEITYFTRASFSCNLGTNYETV